MSRIRIDLPERYDYGTRIPIRVDDLNYAGHLANDAVLAIAHEARLRWLHALGFASELDVAGVGLIMADAAVVFRAEGRHGMELQVEIAMVEVRSRGFELVYRLVDARDGTEIAQLKTAMLWFDYGTRKVGHAPQAFTAATSGRRGTGGEDPPTTLPDGA
jgi:4-hydroxybenzoyl-CoA thioesterase